MRSINVSNLLKSATRAIKSLAGAVMGRPVAAVRGIYTFDAPTGRLCVAGRELILRPKTAALFQVLTAQPGRIVSKDELLDRVWPGLVVQEQAVFQCINEIRRACGTKDCIRTHARQGYQWVGLPQMAPPHTTSLRGRLRIGPRIAVAAAGCAVLLVAVATVPVEQQPADGKVRIAVLPVSGENFVPRDRGLSLGFMDMLNQHAATLARARIVPASTALDVVAHNPGLEQAAMRRALNADIIVQAALVRHGEVLSADFTITGQASGRTTRISGTYESASPAWLAQQIAYEIRDALHYSLQPGADTAARTARQRELIAAKRLLHRSHTAEAGAVFTALAADDPTYLSARYLALWTRRELGTAVAREEVTHLLDAARSNGDVLNETRALLLAARTTARVGDKLATTAYADAGRALAAQYDFHFLGASFDFDSGLTFSAQGAYERAASAFRQAEAHFRRADCAVGLLATYQHLEQTYRAAGAESEAQTVADRIQALEAVFPQTLGHALRGA